MKKGERWILGIMGISALFLAGVGYLRDRDQQPDRGIPFYSTLSEEDASRATELIRRENCRDCHSLWTIRNPLQAVPAPMLDGIGSLHDEAWFYRYLSAKDPQAMVPSRLRPEYRMPSYASLPDAERRLLASYMASLKAQDWYLDDLKKAEHHALTGKD